MLQCANDLATEATNQEAKDKLNVTKEKVNTKMNFY